MNKNKWADLIRLLLVTNKYCGLEFEVTDSLDIVIGGVSYDTHRRERSILGLMLAMEIARSPAIVQSFNVVSNHEWVHAFEFYYHDLKYADYASSINNALKIAGLKRLTLEDLHKLEIEKSRFGIIGGTNPTPSRYHGVKYSHTIK